MARLSFVRCVYALGALSSVANAAVTVYSAGVDKGAAAAATQTAAAATYSGSAAYDPTVLQPPAPPDQFNRDFTINLPQGGIGGLSVPQPGQYLGFSIELSLATRVIGTNSSVLFVPFLNYMQNIAARAGKVRIRVGGNTQELSIMKDVLDNGKILEKTGVSATTTGTPHTEFTPELIKMMGSVSQLIKSEILLGLNFMNITDATNQAQIAALAEQTLGDSLHGIALGNEPDLYELPGHNKRPNPYSFDTYMNEWGNVANTLAQSPGYSNKQMLMGPSTCCQSSNPEWSNVNLANAGYLQRFANELKIVTVQRYPTSNCIGGTVRDPQETFPQFLSHQLLSQQASEYTEFSGMVQAAGKPLYMLETNTAACGGFPGISDSFGAGLWAVDWSLKLATMNFTTTLLHVGGQGDYYNPFTPPPTNQSTFRQWSTGSTYYSILIGAEFFGKSGQAQIADLNANDGENLTPGYVVYEQGVPTRVLLINYVTDPSGNHDVTARIAVAGNAPTQVKVKYFSAPSVSFKGNMTWAGQTLGNNFEADGRLKNDEVIETVQCTGGSCPIPLKAPSLALVFLTDAALANSSPDPSATQTFPTTFLTKVRNTATIDQAVLATSNGRGGGHWGGGIIGSTSFGSTSGAMGVIVPSLGLLSAIVAGGLMVLGRW
ncbi:glycoside hydrolase family 79 protein [Ceratobasidium sp. AG-Ba]|nr:glycoside hydrolase family 79 protein [Ceratobasidium sp. AG-Ba]